MNNPVIVLMEFGSSVYGTSVPSSDLDIKGVILPTSEQILLQKTPYTIQNNTKKDKEAKNTSNDIDTEMFGIQRYLKLLMEGQTVALDMLHTPEQFYRSQADHWWHVIKDNKSKFLHSGTASFVGYTKQQASKYGIKGSRVAAVRLVLEHLKSFATNSFRLGELFLNGLPENMVNEHTAIVMCKAPNGKEEPHLEVCNRKVPFHAKVKYAIEVFQRIFDEYGHRALLAEKNEGLDHKALMHAVRVAREAEELLLTGNITFPRPEKDLLLQIRKGELPYQQVADIIEEGLVKMEEAKIRSVLPEKPDFEFADKLIHAIHEEIVVSGTLFRSQGVLLEKN